MLVNLKDFWRIAKRKVKLVRDMLKGGKNIYKDISGKECEINYELFDAQLGLKRHIVSMTVLYPGKVGKEYKMTTGHVHGDAEEVYYFLSGHGQIVIDKEVMDVKPSDLASVPAGAWHRVINTGSKKLIFLAIFEKYKGRD